MDANYAKLGELIQYGESVRSKYSSPYISGGAVAKWRTECRIALERILGPENSHVREFVSVSSQVDSELALGGGLGLLQGLHASTKQGLILLKRSTDSANGGHLAIERICDRFHGVAMQLRKRHDHRDTLWITDEYDVQDLLHTLLRVFFDAIRPEEWTPSYAGQSARMDFLLKQEKTVIQTKMTSERVRDREIGNQLIEDIARYKGHADCKQLVCFVYDPEHRISNPRGLEFDLGKQSGDEFSVVVFIRPN